MAQTKGFRTAKKRYQYLFWPLIIVYVATILLAASVIDENASPLLLKVCGALLVTLPLFGMLYAMRRLTEETDEYTRLRKIRAMRDAGLITAGAAFLVGFLQIFGAIADFSVFWFGPLFFLSYGLSSCSNLFGRTV